MEAASTTGGLTSEASSRLKEEMEHWRAKTQELQRQVAREREGKAWQEKVENMVEDAARMCFMRNASSSKTPEYWESSPRTLVRGRRNAMNHMIAKDWRTLTRGNDEKIQATTGRTGNTTAIFQSTEDEFGGMP